MEVQAYSKRTIWSLAGLLLVLWALLSVASYWLLALPRQSCFDFYPRWVGARVVLAGGNPYAQEVDWAIQEATFGRRVEPGEIDHRFAYPATVTWILFPFWLLPFPLSVSVWCGLQMLLLLVLPLAVATLLGWQPGLLQLATVLLFSLLAYRHPINVYLLGQFVPFILACLVGGWWGMDKCWPVVTVMFLVGATIRPEMALLPTLLLLTTAWREGKGWAIGVWAALMGLLWLATRVWVGPWVMDFLNGARAYPGYSFFRWPPLALGAGWLAWFLAGGVLIWAGWMLTQISSFPIASRLPWEISTVLLVALIVLPQTNNYTLVLALLPAWVTLWASGERWLDWVPVLVVLASPWAFHAARDSLPPGLEQLLIPLALGVLLTLRLRVWLREGLED
jgi:hypothetical protein